MPAESFSHFESASGDFANQNHNSIQWRQTHGDKGKTRIMTRSTPSALSRKTGNHSETDDETA